MKKALFGRSSHKVRGEKSRSKLLEEAEEDAMTSAKASSCRSIQEDCSVSDFTMGTRGQSVDGSVISRQEAENLRERTLPTSSVPLAIKEDSKRKKRSSQIAANSPDGVDTKRVDDENQAARLAKISKKTSSREKHKVSKASKGEINSKLAILPSSKGKIPSDYNASIVVAIMLHPPKKLGAQSIMSHWYDLVVCA